MSIIIREVGAPASEWVYLDNTTNYTDRQSKRLTSNPIENRSVVADHGIKDNRKFSIAGSISPWDFHLAGGSARANSDGLAAVTTVGSIVVDKTTSDYLPSVISQYSDFTADVKVADITLNQPSVSHAAYLNSVKVRLQALYDGDGLVDVYFSDYSGEGEKLISSVVITSMVFSEDLNTGDSRRIDLSFEQPTIAYVSTEAIPADLIQEQAELENKGNVTGSEITEKNDPNAYSIISENIVNPFFKLISGGS
jgi:hypothetical protein